MNADYNYPLAVLAALDRNPSGVALASGSQVLKGGELATLTRRFAMHLSLRGVNPQSCVIIALQSASTAFVAALAVGLLGARWVRVHPDLPLDMLGTTYILCDPSTRSAFRHPRLYVIDSTWSLDPARFPSSQLGRLKGFSSPEDVAYIARSSGTTGRPKFLIKTCEHFFGAMKRNSLDGYRAIAPLASSTSSMGFRYTVAAMIAGVRVVWPTERYDGEVVAMQRMGVDFVEASPTQVDALCKGAPPMPERIGRLWVGGSAISRKAIAHWLNYFEQVTLVYGGREGGGGGSLTLREIDDTTELAYTLRSGTEAQIVGDDGEVLPHSVPGVLRLRSSGMASGYIGEPEANAEAFREGWFTPGDIAMLTPDGRMKILGRTKDQLNLGGLKFNAADIDEAARSVAGVDDVMCFAEEGPTGIPRLSLCVVSSSQEDRNALAAAIRRASLKFSLSARISHVYFVEALPVNDNGKPMRSEGPRAVAGHPSF